MKGNDVPIKIVPFFIGYMKLFNKTKIFHGTVLQSDSPFDKKKMHFHVQINCQLLHFYCKQISSLRNFYSELQFQNHHIERNLWCFSSIHKL